MTYKLPYYMANCPNWWQNFIASIENAATAAILALPGIEITNIDEELGTLEFESEEAYIAFVMRWS